MAVVDADHQVIIATTLNNAPTDIQQLVFMIERTRTTAGTMPKMWSADAGYCSAGNLEHVKDIETAHNTEFFISTRRMKHGTPVPEAPRGRIPASVTWSIVNFGAACNGGPLLDICTKAKKGRKVVITEHHRRQRAHRATSKDTEFQNDYRQYRPLIEGTVAWLVGGNNRRLRYRGTIKNHAWLETRMAGLNLRRLLKLGLTDQNGAWALG